MTDFLVSLKHKFLKSKEAKNASWLIGGKVVQIILSFFISIFTARYLGPSNYGIIGYVSAYVAFFTSFCTLGINSVIIKEFADHPDKQGETIGTALLLRAISSALSIAAITAIVRIADGNDPTITLTAILCSIALVFQVADTINYWFQSRYESKITALATLVAYLVTSAYKIFLLAAQKNIQWFAFSTSVDYLCVALLLFAAYWYKSGPKLSFSWKRGKSLLRKSYHYILSGMMIAIYGQTDKFMLKHMLGETSVGYYSLASTLNGMWVFVLAAIIDSVYPTIIGLYQTDRRAFEKKNRQLYAIIIYISMFVAICFMLLGRLAIWILYGEAYVDAAKPLSIITWYTVFSYLGVARNAWIVCENRQKYLKYMYFGAAVINVALNLVLIPLWGASGAAAASLITQISTSIILPAFIKEMRPNVKLMLDAFLLRGIK